MGGMGSCDLATQAPHLFTVVAPVAAYQKASRASWKVDGHSRPRGQAGQSHSYQSLLLTTAISHCY